MKFQSTPRMLDSANADKQRNAYFAAPIPIAELERRWSGLSAAMSAQGVDCLVLQATNNTIGGYVRYLTDLAVGDVYANTPIFPPARRDDRDHQRSDRNASITRLDEAGSVRDGHRAVLPVGAPHIR